MVSASFISPTNLVQYQHCTAMMQTQEKKTCWTYFDSVGSENIARTLKKIKFVPHLLYWTPAATWTGVKIESGKKNLQSLRKGNATAFSCVGLLERVPHRLLVFFKVNSKQFCLQYKRSIMSVLAVCATLTRGPDARPQSQSSFCTGQIVFVLMYFHF